MKKKTNEKILRKSQEKTRLIDMPTLPGFKADLKTYFFRQAFPYNSLDACTYVVLSFSVHEGKFVNAE